MNNNTNPTQTAEWIERSFWEGLRPDPLPVPPGWLTPEQRSAWILGAREGIAQGRRLAAEEQAAVEDRTNG